MINLHLWKWKEKEGTGAVNHQTTTDRWVHGEWKCTKGTVGYASFLPHSVAVCECLIIIKEEQEWWTKQEEKTDGGFRHSHDMQYSQKKLSTDMLS